MLLFLREKLCIFEIPLVLGYCTGGGVFGETMSLPLPPTLMWTFYSLFLRSCSASFLGKYSICTCRFGVSMVGGEFRIFLCCHLELPSPYLAFRMPHTYLEQSENP